VIPRHIHTDGIQERIGRLENLVTNLVSQSQDQRTVRPYSDDSIAEDATGVQNSSTSGSVVKDGSTAYEKIGQGIGVMKVSEHYSLYRGATHWSDVLQEVRALFVLGKSKR
jgi:hypothetical protein